MSARDPAAVSSFLRPAVLRALALGAALDIVVLDQISKWAVLEGIVRPAAGQGPALGIVEWLASDQRLDPVRVEILPFLNVVMVWNRGVSFGMLDEGVTPLALVGLAVLITGVFGVWLARTVRGIEAAACALVIGGAVGNIVDRLRFGAVADFIDIHVGGWHWPAFNLADSCITLGIALVVIDALFLTPGRHRREVAS
jgi:signal peptidase II